MTLTPCDLALASIAAPEPESRLTSSSTFAPFVIACSACCCCVDLSPSAFWISRRRRRPSNASLQERPVDRLPAHRRLRVGQQDGDLAGLLASDCRLDAAGARSSSSSPQRGDAERGECRQHRPPAPMSLNVSRCLLLLLCCRIVRLSDCRAPRSPAAAPRARSARPARGRARRAPRPARRAPGDDAHVGRRRAGSRSAGSPRAAGRAGARPAAATLAADDDPLGVEDVAQAAPPRPTYAAGVGDHAARAEVAVARRAASRRRA